MEGPLVKKHEHMAVGTKRQSRRAHWLPCTAVLCGNILMFYVDEDVGKKSPEPRNEVSRLVLNNCICEAARDIVKRKHVFRITFQDRSSYLFESPSAEHLAAWISAVRRVTSKTKEIENTEKLMAQSASKSPQSNSKQEKLHQSTEGWSFRRKIADKFRHVRRRNSASDLLPPILSLSIVGSYDHYHVKVPPLLTICISEIERRGLDQEGIYRLSGPQTQVANLKRVFSKGKLRNLDLFCSNK